MLTPGKDAANSMSAVDHSGISPSLQLRSHNTEGAVRTSQTPSVPRVAFNHTVRGTSPQSALQQLLGRDDAHAAPPNSGESVELSAITDQGVNHVQRSIEQAGTTTSEIGASDNPASWQLQVAQADGNR